MIQSFHRSHAKKPESGIFSDWIGNNTAKFDSRLVNADSLII